MPTKVSLKLTETNKASKQCVLCHSGGNLFTCNSICRRMYHLNCYIPSLPKEAPADWVCLACYPKEQLKQLPNKPKLVGGYLGERDLQILYRLIFEMLCLWPERSTFKSLKPINFPLYKEIIKDPIALDCIIERLDMNSPDQYQSTTEIMGDFRRMFQNCRAFWSQMDSDGVALFMGHANKMEAHFDKQLKDVDHLLSPYDRYRITPSKYRRRDLETPEKGKEIDKMLDTVISPIGTRASKKLIKEVEKASPVKKKRRINFAKGALDDDSIDEDEYTSMSVSRNQLGNIRQCKYCNMIFNRVELLQDHTIKEHFDHKISSILSKSSFLSSPKSNRFCPSCKKRIPIFTALKLHYGKKHYCSDADMNGLLLWAELGNATLYFPKEEMEEEGRKKVRGKLRIV